MLKNLIEIVKSFQSSVNIEYDFNDMNKISDFIPTSSALNIIIDIIKSTNIENTQRARILIGAYGRGKSHIVLVVLSILYNQDRKIFRKFLERVKIIDEESYKIINNYILSKKRLLPVIINGNSGNLTQSFIRALQQTLRLYNLDDIMPKTHFQAVKSTIELWKTKYPETFKRFITMIDIGIEQFIQKLSVNDVSAYEKFIEIYPSLTSGSTFNPFGSFDVVEIYDNVNSALKNKGFSGMYVVYDEFGKYLESSIDIATESETKMLQDFAEKCSRKGSQQLHLMLICHKDITNYIDSNLPQDKVDGWKGISGRFEPINISDNFYQMYEIISYAITKKKIPWESFKKEHKSIFDELLSTCKEKNYLSGKDELVVYGCYPLHPVTAFILPRLSEKIAQNERTLFTYLTSNQKNTLREFIKNNDDDFPIVTPDYLYDYFEQELRKELNTSEIHKIYSLSARILLKVEKDSLSAKIIKTIAIIYFIQQFERVAPTTDTLCDIFSIKFDSKVIMDTIDFLINETYIVYRKDSNNFLCLKETSGVDINKELINRIEKVKSTINMEQALNYCAHDNYLYPVRHNETNCLTRYFELKFISFKNYCQLLDTEIPSNVAGIVYAVFYEEPVESTIEMSIYSKEKQIVSIFPKNFKNIENSIYKYISAIQLREECSIEDAILKNEYDIIVSDLENIVTGFITDYIYPEMNAVDYVYCGEKKKIKRKSKLSELLSDICDITYPSTPIVNNENINKDVLSSVAINSRSKLTTALLDSITIEKNLGLVGTGQDVSFMRSTLIQTHILYQKDGQYILDTENATNSIQNVLNEIKSFFCDTVKTGEKSFSELYDKLTDAKYKIGMKKGSIPIYIAVVLHDMKKNLIFKCNGYETKIDSNTLNAINEKAQIYSVLMENWDSNKSEYLKNLAITFKDYIIESEKRFNSFSYIVNAMIRWYLSLPKCAKEMTRYYDSLDKLELNKQKYISSLKLQITNSRDYLLEELPKILGMGVSKELAYLIKDIKVIFDTAKTNLLVCVIEKLKKEFNGSENKSLTSILMEWYGTLQEHTLQNLFPNNENIILNLIKNITNDENIFAERIGKALTGLRIDDWNFNIYRKFEDSIDDFKKTIEEFNNKKSNDIYSNSKQYKFIIIDEDGKEQIKSFEKVEYSINAKLLYRDITGAIDESGQSISQQEKRQILIEILESLC